MKPRRRRIHPTIQKVVKMLESVQHPYCTIHPCCTAQRLYEDPGMIGIPPQTSSTADQNAQEEQEMVFEPVSEDRAKTHVQASHVEEAHAIVHELSTE